MHVINFIEAHFYSASQAYTLSQCLFIHSGSTKQILVLNEKTLR